MQQCESTLKGRNRTFEYAAVEAAQRELAGVEAGDGRDESNRSLQERLADAQNAQVSMACNHRSENRV